VEAALNSTAKASPSGLNRFLGQIAAFSLSEKMKFAIKASLSLVLAYLIAFSQGWDNASTAVTTIMLIAATGSLGDSVMKGVLRVIGTLIGAVIGMFLIALFPQERELYLLTASVIVTVILYFARAYKGDMTIFLLSAITLMMMFQEGEIDDVFLYGIDKTFMTVFGIAVYTVVGLFLWPVSTKDDSIDQAAALTQAQQALFAQRDAKREERIARHHAVLQAQQALTQTLGRINNSSEENFSRRQWASVLHDYKEITQCLTLLAYHDKTPFADDLPSYVPNFKQLEREISQLLEAVEHAWNHAEEITIPDPFTPRFDYQHINTLSELERASLSSTIEEMGRLHAHLRDLSMKLNAYNSPQPTRFPIRKEAHEESRFLWFDMEHLKGSIVTFLIFWSGALIWIYLNPPGGFLIVSLATGLSVITAFTPVKPSLLIIIFSLAFIFATLMYILVLPHISYSWELALFIFLYGFIGFYFINPQISIFFLLGMVTLNLTNEMYYAFDLFLLVLLLFYAFLFLLLFFYYLPFSTKPEHLFLTMKNRLFSLSANLLEHNRNRILGQHSLWDSIAAAYARHHLMNTVKQMQLWASQIDEKYFHTIDKQKLLAFTQTCESFAYLLQTMYRNDRNYLKNPLIRDFLMQNRVYALIPLLKTYAKGISPEAIDERWKDKKNIIKQMEARLKAFDKNRNNTDYTQEQIMHFYTSVSLHKSVWEVLFEYNEQMAALDLEVLEQSRF